VSVHVDGTHPLAVHHDLTPSRCFAGNVLSGRHRDSARLNGAITNKPTAPSGTGKALGSPPLPDRALHTCMGIPLPLLIRRPSNAASVSGRNTKCSLPPVGEKSLLPRGCARRHAARLGLAPPNSQGAECEGVHVPLAGRDRLRSSVASMRAFSPRALRSRDERLLPSLLAWPRRSLRGRRASRVHSRFQRSRSPYRRAPPNARAGRQ